MSEPRKDIIEDTYGLSINALRGGCIIDPREYARKISMDRLQAFVNGVLSFRSGIVPRYKHLFVSRNHIVEIWVNRC